MSAKNIKEVETDLRSKYHRLREDLPEEEKLRLDPGIQSRLLPLQEYSQAGTVFIYISKELEVDTLVTVQAAWVNQKRMAIPRCTPRAHDIESYYVHSWQDLERVSFGMMEPTVRRCERVENESRGFCLAPGFSLSVQDLRLGYDGGYYDRFLSRSGGFAVDVCYSFCVQ